MEVVLKGYFRVKGIQNDIKLFEKNAIAIMFPYLRAIVSTYTANANVAPVLLPAMNINEYFRKKYEKMDNRICLNMKCCKSATEC